MILLSISIAPAVALFFFFYLRDRYEKEPLLLLWKSFLLGALIVIPACLLESLFPVSIKALGDAGLFTVFVFSFFVAGLVEESGKYIVLRYYAYPKKDFNEPYDGIMYSVMISLGFATVENIFLVLPRGIATGVARGLLAVPAHALFAVVMGYYVGLAKFTGTAASKRRYLLKGWACATLIHGLYDFLLLSNTTLLALLVLPLILVCWRLAFKATRKHAESSPFKDTTG